MTKKETTWQDGALFLVISQAPLVHLPSYIESDQNCTLRQASYTYLERGSVICLSISCKEYALPNVHDLDCSLLFMVAESYQCSLGVLTSRTVLLDICAY